MGVCDSTAAALNGAAIAAIPANWVASHEPQRRSGLRLSLNRYHARLAETEADLAAIFRLRFQVFNLELNEGLDQAYETGEDCDEFDSFCDHLMVEDSRTGQVVGTYRLQSGASATRNIGYYSAREFDFAPYEGLRDTLLELGRACVHRDHRSFDVLMLLWKGIARYASERGLRYLIGCSSLTSQDPREGSAMYFHLQKYLEEPVLRTNPLAAYAFPLTATAGPIVKPPKLLRTYLAIGARICGPPALDREFCTIDFLTLMDLKRLSLRSRLHFWG